MKRQDFLIGSAIFLFFAAAGFTISSGLSSGPAKGFTATMNVTANSENELVTASFDGRKVDLMHEDSRNASFYIDVDRDGSFDRRLSAIHDGRVRRTQEVVTLGKKSYILSFRYIDDAGMEGDSWLRLFLVESI